jgi:M6 family metalloprotease-like protein
MCNNRFFRVLLTLSIILLTFIFSPVSFSQPYQDAECGMTGFGERSLAVQPGGKWMTARDTLNVLIVFVQFPDDAYDTTYTLWPTRPVSGVYPGPTYLRTFVDSLASQMSTNGNLTHYFRDMSMGAFTLIEKTKFVVTPHTYQYYLSNNWLRWNINMEVLQTLDASMDFAEFDRYKRYSEYDIRRESDGRIDDIFMIYRNVPNMSSGFYGGESSLGYPRDYSPYNEPLQFYVDKHRIIGSGHPAVDDKYPGLGTTSVIGGTADGWFGKIPYRVQRHEFAHHWMTDGTYYGHSGRGFWGMLNDWGVRVNSQDYCPPNSYERELLGWHAPDSIFQTTLNVTLSDYVQNNSSVKIKVPGNNPNEFFRLEYHLRLSQFDVPDMHYPNAKGLYLIHQTGNTNPYSQLNLVPADGRWYWTSDTVVHPAYYPSGLAVYKKTQVDRDSGYVDTRGTRFTWVGPPPTPNVPNPSEIHFYRDIFTNQVIEKTIFYGDGKDEFGIYKNNPITPWSNPNTQNIAIQKTWVSIEITNENLQNGTITFNVRYDSASALALKPSKPQFLKISSSANYHPLLTWAANEEPDLVNYKVYKYVSFDLGWQFLASTGATSYEDLTEYYCTAPPPQQCMAGHDIYYRITVMDNQSKESIPSDSIKTHVQGGLPQKIASGSEQETIPKEYSLKQNYPNPFNPATNIVYQLPKGGLVQLKIYDILGREVAVLVNEVKAEGLYEVSFDASNLPSGVYVYSLRVNEFVQNNKMTLLK